MLRVPSSDSCFLRKCYPSIPTVQSTREALNTDSNTRKLRTCTAHKRHSWYKLQLPPLSVVIS